MTVPGARGYFSPDRKAPQVTTHISNKHTSRSGETLPVLILMLTGFR